MFVAISSGESGDIVIIIGKTLLGLMAIKTLAYLNDHNVTLPSIHVDQIFL